MVAIRLCLIHQTESRCCEDKSLQELVAWFQRRGDFSLAACQSAEAVDVVSAALLGVVVALLAGLVALLHALKHFSASVVAHAVGGSTEVAGEEGSEAWDAHGGGRSTCNLGGVGRSEQVRRVDLEEFQVGVGQLTNVKASLELLEGVAGHHSGMRVVYKKLEHKLVSAYKI